MRRQLSERTDNTFLVKDGCVYRRSAKDETKYIANFTASPTAEIMRDNGQEQTREYAFEGRLFNGDKLPRIVIPSSDFTSMNWITKHWGLAPCLSPSPTSTSQFRAYLQGQAVGIPRSTVYTHTGFRRIDGNLCYLHSGGALGADSVCCELEGDLSRYRFITDSKIKTGQGAAEVLELFKLAPPSISFPLLAYIYLAPLVYFCGLAGIAPSFSLYVTGETGSFKTVLSMLYLSHFREYRGMSETPPTNFHSTANAIEKMAFSLKDMPLLVDDLHPTSTAEKGRMDAIAQRLARGSGDHIGRGRMNSDTTLKASYYPRGLTVITGEDIPDIGQSGLARFYFVRLEKGMIDKAGLTKRQAKAEYYNVAMQGYIAWLIQQADGLPDLLRDMFHSSVQKLRIRGAHNRLAPNIAWLHLGIWMLSQYLFELGLMSESECRWFRDKSWEVFLSSGKDQTAIQGEERPVHKFLSTLDELLSSQRHSTVDLYADIGRSEQAIGYHDEGNLYLFPEIAYNIVKRYHLDNRDSFPVSKNRLFSDLAKAGLLETQSGRNTVQKRIGGTARRWLVLKKDAFKLVRGSE